MQHGVGNQEWKDLYRLSVWAAIVSELILLLALATFFIWPYAPGSSTTETIFALLQSNPLGGAISLDLFLLVGNLVTLPLFVVLYVSLKPINPSYALMALVTGIVAVVLIVPARPILEMFALSGRYAAADPVSQGRILAAGDALLAAFNGTSWAGNTFLGGLSLLVSSVLMLRSNVYGRLTAVVGIATNVAVCSFFLPVIGVVLLFLTVPGYMLWYALLARSLFRASRI